MRTHRIRKAGTAVMTVMSLLAGVLAVSVVTGTAAQAATLCPAGSSQVNLGGTPVCEQQFIALGTWNVPAGVTTADVLVVGGGGGGGGSAIRFSPSFRADAGNGGGGGTAVLAQDVPVSGSVLVAPGSGGAGGAGGDNVSGQVGVAGGPSVFGSIVASGGSGGQGGVLGGGVSRGGSSGRDLAGSVATYDGGVPLSDNPLSVGGGGAGAGSPVNGPSTLNATLTNGVLRAGDGGNGVNTGQFGGLFDSGEAVRWFAGGGAGGVSYTGQYMSSPGAGGGGNSGWASQNPDAVAHTGGGGGGGGPLPQLNWRAGQGGLGGSGIVIVRWAVPPSVFTTTLPAAQTDGRYEQSVRVANTSGRAPFTFTVVAGSLPAGLTMSADGVISGVPTAAGTSNFTVKVTDAFGGFDTAALSIDVEAGLSITTTGIPTGSTFVPYSTTFAGSGGGTPYVWSISSGALPAGLSLSSAGVLSGTPTVAGAFSFDVKLTDANGLSTIAPFRLDVGLSPPLAITTASLPAATVSEGYSQVLAATGGVGARTWSISAGSLPAGLTLTADGTLKGTPTASGTANFTVRVTTGTETVTKALAMVVRAPLDITTTSVPSGATLVPYSTTLAATGGTSYTWAVTAGSLPAGLSLSSTGVLSGTPTTAGTSSFTVTVTDNFSRTQVRAYSMAIAQSPALTIVTTTVPDANVGLGYTQLLQATGGVGARTWSVSAGSLPAGLTLGTDGTISGTPTSAGTSNFTVQVTTGSETVTQALSLVVRAQLDITTDTLPDAATLTPYSTTFAASGGSPYTWAVTAGSLPAGLSLATDGTLSGTPTTAGTSTFTVTVTDAFSRTLAKTFALGVSQSPPLVVVTTSLTAAEEDTSYSTLLQATGGVGTHTWSVLSGSLPAGLTLQADGTLTGVPTAAGTSSFTVRVTTGSETATKALSLTVRAQLTISTTNLFNGATLVPYSATFVAVGGSSYSWAVTADSLPAGLSLSSGGVISGTPTTAGISAFTVTVTDNFSRTISKRFALMITQSPALAMDPPVLDDGEVDTAYTRMFQATGGVGTRTWSVSSGSLPPGMTLQSDGTLTGIPTTAGTSNFTVQVTTGTETVSSPVTLVVRALLEITTDSLDAGATFVPYSVTLVAVGGAPYTWAVTGGSLPAGLSLATDGTISGTPTTAGIATFTVTVTDTFSRTQAKEFAIGIALTPPLAIDTDPLPRGTVDQGYAGTVQATGGVGSRTWSIVSGSLPPGLGMDADGVITGTPTSTGTFTFTVRVQTGTETVDLEKSITIDNPVQINAATLPNVKAGTALTPQTFTAVGGDGTFTWSLAGGKLPAGLSLSSTGRLSGTVSAMVAAGVYTFSVRATDGFGGTDTREFTVQVMSPVKVLTNSLPPANSSGSYRVTLIATGGAGPYSWSESSPALPSGLTLNASTGELSGVVRSAGTYTFRVQVNDSNGNPGSRLFTLTVSNAAVPQSQSCATLPSTLPVNGTRVLVAAGCRTNAGQIVTASVRCVWGIARQGDLQMCSLVRDAKGRQVVRTYGKHPITVQVTLRAKATTGYQAYLVTRTYRIR